VNRFYSPQQGRFTQVDPIGMGAASLSNPQTLNLYAYCGNDPINHFDPDGLFFGFIIGAIAAIAGAVATAVNVVISVVVKVLAVAARALIHVVGKLGFLIRSNASQLMVSLEDDALPWSPDWLRIIGVAAAVAVGAVALLAQGGDGKLPERPKMQEKGKQRDQIGQDESNPNQVKMGTVTGPFPGPFSDPHVRYGLCSANATEAYKTAAKALRDQYNGKLGPSTPDKFEKMETGGLVALGREANKHGGIKNIPKSGGYNTIYGMLIGAAIDVWVGTRRYGREYSDKADRIWRDYQKAYGKCVDTAIKEGVLPPTTPRPPRQYY
jgi:hypothetical protein